MGRFNYMGHKEIVQSICQRALRVLKAGRLHFRPMKKRGYLTLSGRGNYILGRTNLKSGLITIDIFTPKLRKPKKISSILRILCHEIAHHQKPPFRQRYKGRFIIRQHYPDFYKQVNKNILKLKRDKVLGEYFK